IGKSVARKPPRSLLLLFAKPSVWQAAGRARCPEGSTSTAPAQPRLHQGTPQGPVCPAGLLPRPGTDLLHALRTLCLPT
uniref:Uncharacterized protein n=1 Tax=Anser brachyrhynchus TaxID=132585 RepID=A0A8B9I8Z6_9AVES